MTIYPMVSKFVVATLSMGPVVPVNNTFSQANQFCNTIGVIDGVTSATFCQNGGRCC